MKRWALMTTALALWTILPNPGKELGQMRPAAVWIVREQDHELTIMTDTGDMGYGETLHQAIENMENAASGYMLYDTVEDLIVAEEYQYLIPQIKEYLRPSVNVCRADTDIPAEGVWEYLRIHRPNVKLAEMNEGTKLQILRYEEERFSIEQQDG